MPLENRQILMNKNLVKVETNPMPLRDKVGSPARTKMDRAQAKAQARDAQRDPAYNPAGKGKFEFSYAPYGPQSDHYTYAKPDAGHAARLRGAAARKTSATPAYKPGK